jgi:hypothetical protein
MLPWGLTLMSATDVSATIEGGILPMDEILRRRGCQ